MVYLHSLIAVAIMLLNNNKKEKRTDLMHFNISLVRDQKIWEEWGGSAGIKILTAVSSKPHNPQYVNDKV